MPDVSLLPVHTRPITPDQVRDLKSHLDAGGTVLVAITPDDPIALELAGVEIADQGPDTEWFVTLTDRPEASRLTGEVPVCGPLAVLRPVNDDVEVVATTSVRFAHGPTMTVRRCGPGRVIASGIGDLGAVLNHPVLGTYIHRLAAAATPAPTDEIGDAVVGYGPFGGRG
ncbi:MAG: hypothetical protein ACO307_15735, partial [Ilumatobacteraceae bacterium]